MLMFIYLFDADMSGTWIIFWVTLVGTITTGVVFLQSLKGDGVDESTKLERFVNGCTYVNRCNAVNVLCNFHIRNVLGSLTVYCFWLALLTL